MKRLVALSCLLWILALVGTAVPCVAAADAVALDACCQPDGDCEESAPPEPSCPCCPQMRPSLLVMGLTLAVPVTYPAPAICSATGQHESPDPREILHVPKLAASNG